jgi:O-acetyl-ADP-ribose deacetylase (regulator of RNase III)
MLLKYTDGDLLDMLDEGRVNYVLHCCNCQAIMGSGIAVQIKNRYPAVYQAYLNHHDLMGLELGTVSYGKIGDIASMMRRYIFNLHAQHLFGTGDRFVDYEALYKSMERARDIIVSNIGGVGTVGVPYNMAAFRAGGDFRIVETMLEVIFENTSLDVMIVKYNGKNV